MEWSVPITLNNLRGFLGLIGYYHTFVKNNGRIVAPLVEFLIKQTFYCTQEETKYFEKII